MSADTKGRRAKAQATASPSTSREKTTAVKDGETHRRRRLGLAVLVAIALAGEWELLEDSQAPAGALATSYLDTSCRLWIDGGVLLSGGSPGRSEAETRSAYHSALAALPSGRTEAELKLEVANFVHLRGGPFQGIILGDEDYLRRYDSWCFITELVTMGILVFRAASPF